MKHHRNTLILLFMAALVAVSVYFIVPPAERTHLGLDLQGGLDVVYTARTTEGNAPTSEQLDQTITILNRRVNGLGVTESAIQKQGTDQISVALPGIDDPQQALDVIGKTAQLEFYKMDSAAMPVGFVESKEEALKQLRGQGVAQTVVDQLAAEGTTKGYSLVRLEANANDNVPELWFVFVRPPTMTGDAVMSALASRGQTGLPNVTIEFTDEGSKQFQEITRELYRTGLLKGESQTFAIVLDNTLESYPQIDYTDATLRDGIEGGAEISGGNMTVQESQDLAFVLNTGALPVKLDPSYQQQVSATLGKDSLRQALIAGIAGLGLVLLYMLVYYRFLGLVADLALIVYGVLLWGLFNAIPVTLSLPGIAGMILTIGVAADANVVIFERIKEEVRHGKTVRSAVSSGYSRGFKTILDANILTVLTAAVLFVFASASPKGFALTLILGVVVSMLTAVLFTRAVLGLLAGFAAFNKPAFMGVRSSQVVAAAVPSASTSRRRRGEPQAVTAAPATGFWARVYRFDFMGRKRWWFALSAAVILIGLGSLFIRGGGNPVQGLTYGLEFKEGTRISVAFEEQPSLAQVREVISAAGFTDAQIQETANVAGTGTSGFQLQTETLTTQEQEELRTALNETFTIASADGSAVYSLEAVGATFGKQVVTSSLQAMVIALFLILVYVTLRFKWQFAVGAIAAEIHDLLIVVGVYSLTGREVTTATIAAVLTILGYSLYDTVIIYDRIRENEPLLSRHPYGEIVNVSLSQTLTRSMNTSLTTLLPVVCLLLFGGTTLKDFAFALLIGILSGAYSSIFVASPITTVLKERSPQWRKLKLAARSGKA